MGHYHVNVYAEQLNNVDFFGIADIDSGKVSELSEKYQIEGYNDYRELLKNVDFVSIAVPTKNHYEVASAWLEAGGHVLVEQPVTTEYGQAEELFQIANKKKLILPAGPL